MKTLRTVLVAILLPVAFPAAAVPTSEYYLTPSGLAGSEELNMLTVISGSTFSQFPQNNPLVAQTPIAVNGVIRTAGSRVDEQPGSTYSLSGTFLGPSGTWSGPVSIFDGTTDGQFNYAFNWGGGGVYQFGTDWSGGSLLFPLAQGGSHLGITYDPTDDTFWISGWTSNVVEHRDRSGALLDFFNADFFTNALTALALDHADGTLWLGSQGNLGEFAQYSKSGTLLSTASYALAQQDNALGGEFDFAIVPEPSTVALLALGLVGIAAVQRRRAL